MIGLAGTGGAEIVGSGDGEVFSVLVDAFDESDGGGGVDAEDFDLAEAAEGGGAGAVDGGFHGGGVVFGVEDDEEAGVFAEEVAVGVGPAAAGVEEGEAVREVADEFAFEAGPFPAVDGAAAGGVFGEADVDFGADPGRGFAEVDGDGLGVLEGGAAGGGEEKGGGGAGGESHGHLGSSEPRP